MRKKKLVMQIKAMEPKKPAHKLGETIHSLLGWKSHLTSNWVKSVCDIMTNGSSLSIESKLKNKSAGESTTISKIGDELVVFADYMIHLNAQRRWILNEFLDLRGNIRVFCRIRPISEGENFGGSQPVAALDSSNVLLKLSDNKSKTYTFDKVFSPGSSQDEVFAEVEPVIKSALDGYNACIFAYGQTGTGKSFTMEGAPNTPGVVSHAMESIFKQASDSNHVFLFGFSMLEIYIGNLKDLLVPQPTKPMDPMPPCLSIQTDPKGGIEIDKLVAIRVTDFNQALRLYRLGCRYRSTASTNSNSTSSRSHCLIRLSITCLDTPERRRETNKIWFIDLGGSERVLKTKASGKRLDEGKAINLSLSALGDVIHALHKKNRHVPFRNSKLTQVLKDSLGEDSKTLMLVHISPKDHDICETVCSLGFATRVRSINLGNTETNEEKERREVSITNLQRKMKMIEDEQQEVRKSIVKLKGELEKLTGKAQLPIDEPKLNDPVTKKSDSTDPKEAQSSEIPRFMKATVCSTRRKSALDYQTFEETVKRRIKRPSSHRAESVSFPVKRRSEYNSECSISGNSCLVGLNAKSNADDQTEYSHDVTESTECETSSKRSLVQCKGVLGKKNSNFLSTNITKVDNWLRLHKNEPTIRSSTIYRKSNRILAIPLLEKKQTRKESEKFDVPETNFDIDKETMERTGSFVGEASVKDEKRDRAFSPTEIRCSDSASDERLSFNSNRDEDRENNTVAVTSKAKENSTQRSSDCTSVDGDERLCVFSCSEGLNRYNEKSVDSMFETRKDSVESPSVPTEIRNHISSKKGIDTIGSMPSIKYRRAQRALFMDNGNQKDIIRPQAKSPEKINTSGIYHLFAERLRIVWVTALLAIGFRHLGFDHEFFHGLTL